MSETPTCVYCGSLVDPTKPYWVVERWEDGQCVARGFVNHAGCLIATAHSQRPRDANSVPDYEGSAPESRRVTAHLSCLPGGTHRYSGSAWAKMTPN